MSCLALRPTGCRYRGTWGLGTDVSVAGRTPTRGLCPAPPWTLLPRPLLPPPSAPSHQPCSGQQPLALQERMWTEAEAASASLALTAPGSRPCARHLLPLVGQLAGRGQLPHPWAAAVVSWGCGGQAPQSGRPETAGLCLPVLVRSLNKIQGSRCWAPPSPRLWGRLLPACPASGGPRRPLAYGTSASSVTRCLPSSLCLYSSLKDTGHWLRGPLNPM